MRTYSRINIQSDRALPACIGRPTDKGANMTKFWRVSVFVAILLLLPLASPVAAPASHCTTTGPWARIASGYYATGGLGALDGTGCDSGAQKVDTRVMLPSSDFVLLILVEAAPCSPGVNTTTGTITGFGGFAGRPWSGQTITLTCSSPASSPGVYISEILDTGCGLVGRVRVEVLGITISPGGHPPTCVPPSGHITGSVNVPGTFVTKTACTKTLNMLGNCGGTN